MAQGDADGRADTNATLIKGQTPETPVSSEQRAPRQANAIVRGYGGPSSPGVRFVANAEAPRAGV
jgi:hypothetical protein